MRAAATVLVLFFARGSSTEEAPAEQHSPAQHQGPWRVAEADDCDSSVTQTLYASCPDIPEECSKCVPRDCTYEEWSEWRSFGHCIGLCERHRKIGQHANECGKACSGATRQTKECLSMGDWLQCTAETQDCVWHDWTSWSNCTSPIAGQTFRTREIRSYAIASGEPCRGPISEMAPCGKDAPIDCELSSWEEWSTCSATCGSGRQSRMRRRSRLAQNGGRPCTGSLWENRACSIQPCEDYRDCMVGDWSNWRGCSSEDYLPAYRDAEQRFRERAVVQHATGGGAGCTESLFETEGCNRQHLTSNCTLTSWSEWDSCSRSCGGGHQHRVRHVKDPPEGGGTCPDVTLRVMRACNQNPCNPEDAQDCTSLPDWSSWSTCTTTCGPGTQVRNRARPRERCFNATFKQVGLKEERGCSVKPCPVADCEWGQWEDWGSCSATCGGGSRQRSRAVKVPPRNGGRCEPKDTAVVGPCNTQPCLTCVDGQWGDWGEWSDCSTSSGTGFRSRQRAVAQHANSCGKPTLGEADEFEVCSSTPSKDCELSDWGKWSDCSSKCFGFRKRERRVVQNATGDGRLCVNETLQEMEQCSPAPHEQASPDCLKGKDAPCELSEWSDWAACSATCGGGKRTRHSHIVKVGKNCSSQKETEDCAEQPCPISCKDCKWGTWSEWGQCSACRGQRWRHRKIAQLPNACGKPCDVAMAREVSNCTGLCDLEDRICAWSEWTSMTSCRHSCNSAQTRQRHLRLLPTPLAAGKSQEYMFKAMGNTTCTGTQTEEVLCSSASGFMEMHLANVTSNNLGGRGPNFKDPQNIRYAAVGQEANTSVDLVFELLKGSYVPADVARNGVVGNSFGVINVADDSSVKLRGKFVKAGTNESVTIHKFYLNFYGIDATGSGATETITIRGYDSYNLSANTEVNYTAEDGGGRFAASEAGSATADPAHPVKLTQEQEAHKVTLIFNSTAEFGVDLSVSKGDGSANGSNFLFSGVHHGGGQQEEEVTCKDECVPQPCVWAAWSDWQELQCSGLCQRHRVIERVNNECAPPCSGAIISTKQCETACAKKDCAFSEWSSWTDCGEGDVQHFRTRNISSFPTAGGADCMGLTEEVGTCAALNATIAPCELTEWSPWQECSRPCGGFTTRHRFLKHPSKSLRMLCNAPLEELKPCDDDCTQVRQDCELTDWQEWSLCSASQRYRSRKVARPALLGGRDCNDTLREVRGCNVDRVDCIMSNWSAYEECTATCNGGQRRWNRHVVRYPEKGGKSCPTSLMKTEACNTEPCEENSDCKVSDWSSFTPCSATCGIGVQTRSRDVLALPAAGGKTCDLALSEVRQCTELKPCESADCEWEDWQEWSSCPKTCGGGVRTRKRLIKQAAKPGGRACSEADTEEVEQCNTQPCGEPPCEDAAWLAWSDWGTCSQSCGGGLMSRSRRYSSKSKGCGKPIAGISEEVRSCNSRRCKEPKECTFSAWADWSTCHQYSAWSWCYTWRERTRVVDKVGDEIVERCDGALHERTPCMNPPNCPKAGEVVDCAFSSWQDWSTCDVTCGGGQQFRGRSVFVEPQNGGKDCSGPINKTRACGTQACSEACKPVDCAYGAWEDWSPCQHCNSQRARRRRVEVPPSCGGRNCNRTSTEEVGDCSHLCKELWCGWSTWQDWGSCSRTCGPGRRKRQRSLVLVPAPNLKELQELIETETSLEANLAEFDKDAANMRGQPIQELVAAFAAGSLCLFLLMSFAKLCARTDRRRGGGQGYQELSGLPQASSAAFHL